MGECISLGTLAFVCALVASGYSFVSHCWLCFICFTTYHSSSISLSHTTIHRILLLLCLVFEVLCRHEVGIDAVPTPAHISSAGGLAWLCFVVVACGVVSVAGSGRCRGLQAWLLMLRLWGCWLLLRLRSGWLSDSWSGWFSCSMLALLDRFLICRSRGDSYSHLFVLGRCCWRLILVQVYPDNVFLRQLVTAGRYWGPTRDWTCLFLLLWRIVIFVAIFCFSQRYRFSYCSSLCIVPCQTYYCRRSWTVRLWVILLTWCCGWNHDLAAWWLLVCAQILVLISICCSSVLNRTGMIWHLEHHSVLIVLIISEPIPHFIHDRLLLQIGAGSRGCCEFASVCDLLLHQSVTFSKHRLLKLDSNDFT